MAGRTATTEKPSQRSLEDLLGPQDEGGALVGPEEVEELRALAARSVQVPRTMVGIAAEDVQKAADLARAAFENSVRRTFTTDWVIFRAKDGAELGFLQDCGCERITGLWGIEFDRLSLEGFREEVYDEGGDRQISWEIMVGGRAALTGEHQVEIGFRSSSGFFGKAWDDSKDKPVERALVRVNIKKSALANGRGRLIRLLTGLGQVPKDQLVKLGHDPKLLRGVRFEQGSRGGGGEGGGASDAQLWKIVGEAHGLQKVAGLGKILGREDLHKLLREEAALTGGKGGTASALIQKLEALKKGDWTVAQFEQAAGVKLAGDEPGAEG